MRSVFCVAAAVVSLSSFAAAQDMDRIATEVFAAAAEGNLPALEAALAAGYDVNYQRNGKSALSMAVIFKRAAAVRLLLERGANPNTTTFDQFVVGFETPRPVLDYARGLGASDIVALIEGAQTRSRGNAAPAAAPSASTASAARAPSSAARGAGAASRPAGSSRARRRQR